MQFINGNDDDGNDDKYIEPIVLNSNIIDDNNTILQQQINQWRSQGYALLDNLLPIELIDNAKIAIEHMVESSDVKVKDDFGLFGFPFDKDSNCLNDIILHPTIIKLVQVLLKQDDIRLTQGEAWLKQSTDNKTKLSNQDQRMHMDYPNHTLLHPPAFDDPEVVAFIIYLDDVIDCGGPTAMVAREGDDDPLYQMPYIQMPGVGRHEWINDRSTAEEYFKNNDQEIYEFRQKLYDKERYVKYKKGTVLVYRLDVWHRGTCMNSNKKRIVINAAYKKAGRDWLTNWEAGIATHAYDRLWGLIPTLSEEQQSLLGIPRLTDSYWTQQNKINTHARYHQQHR